jgi:hypothetical protein
MKADDFFSYQKPNVKDASIKKHIFGIIVIFLLSGTV